MANWTTLVKATGNQPVVIGSVNSFWQTPTPADQGDINSQLPGITALATYYDDQGVTPLTVITPSNSSIFLGFDTNVNLFDSFEIYNQGTLLSQRGKMQQLIDRDPESPFNSQITLYAPHIDFAPLGHIGLIEAFSLNFENLDPGNPFSTEAKDALAELGSRVWNYLPVSGPSWAASGNFTNFFLDQAQGWFARGGAMSYADGTTGDVAVMVIPV